MSQTGQYQMTWQEVRERADKLMNSIRVITNNPRLVFGVPRGGCTVAALIGRPVDFPDHAEVIVDDIIDSGATMKRYQGKYAKPFFALVDRRRPDDADLPWVVFPWEVGDNTSTPEDSVTRLLEYLGEDPGRDGLKDTPVRVIKAYQEMTRGYAMNPSELLRVFDVVADEVIILRGIRFSSLCEHHLLPFSGTATVGYIPKEGKAVGISKLSRVVECFARRLQVQERLTNQIAEAIQQYLNPVGVGVIIKAHHSCMGCRGVNQPEAEMVTSSMLGAMRDRPEARAELLSLS